MEQAINAYRHITATDEFREMERLRSLARHNEAAALRHARAQGAEAEREKWQGVVAEKDAVVAEQATALADLRDTVTEKDAALAEQAALIAELQKQLREGG